MSILTKNKRHILILLFIFPIFFAMSSFVPIVHTGPYVPEDDPNNEWHWQVDEGDTIILEGEFIISNASTGEVVMMFISKDKINQIKKNLFKVSFLILR